MLGLKISACIAPGPKLKTTTIKLEVVNTPMKIKCTLVNYFIAKRAKRKGFLKMSCDAHNIHVCTLALSHLV